MSEYLYGINPAFEAIRSGRRQLYHLYLNQGSESNPRLKKLVQLAEKQHLALSWVDKSKLFDLCQTREHQSCVLETGPFPYTPFAEMLGEPRLVLLDNIEDPHNIGAIARTAEALGWKNLLLPRRGCPLLLPSVVKSAAGACEFLHVAVNCASNQYVKIALEEGYAVISLDGSGPVPLPQVREAGHQKLLLVVGGENAGVSQFILNHSTAVASIPQCGHINSLNASVAAALALYLLA